MNSTPQKWVPAEAQKAWNPSLDLELPPVLGTIAAILGTLLAAGAAVVGLAAGGGGGDGGGGPCFIATAAFGTPMAAELDTLRAVRDTYLLNNAVGTALVDAYYHVSPAIANVVAKSPALAATVRVLLTPVVFASKLVLAMPACGMALASLAGLVAVVRRRRHRKA